MTEGPTEQITILGYQGNIKVEEAGFIDVEIIRKKEESMFGRLFGRLKEVMRKLMRYFRF